MGCGCKWWDMFGRPQVPSQYTSQPTGTHMPTSIAGPRGLSSKQLRSARKCGDKARSAKAKSLVIRKLMASTADRVGQSGLVLHHPHPSPSLALIITRAPSLGTKAENFDVDCDFHNSIHLSIDRWQSKAGRAAT